MTSQIQTAIASLTEKQRAAAAECAHLIVLLSESDTPHARELALIVLTRLQGIVLGGATLARVTDEDLAVLLSIGVAQ